MSLDTIEVSQYGQITKFRGQRRKLPPLRDIRRRLKRAQPYLAAFTHLMLEHISSTPSEIHTRHLEDPDTMPVVVIPFTTIHFRQYAQYTPVPIPNQRHPTLTSDMFWVSGMQAWVVHEVYLVVNPETRATIVFYRVMNDEDPDAVAFLGPLVPGHRFTRVVWERTQQFLSTLYAETNC